MSSRLRHRVVAPEHYRVTLDCQPPYDWPAVLAFLAARSTPGVEEVRDGRYRRTTRLGAGAGLVEASMREDGSALTLDVHGEGAAALAAIAGQARSLFDLDASPVDIQRHLGADALTGPLVARAPGVRVPGAWDGFEMAVRAILGQQVSVRAATTLAGRIAAGWGTPVDGSGSLNRLFPSAADLREAALERVGIIRTRATTIRTLAQATVDGHLALDPGGHSPAVRDRLLSIPGIGPWTAQYIAMRALRDPDAFPHGDLVLRRVAGGLTAAALERRSDAWRPRRAYAVLLLWRKASESGRVDPRPVGIVK